MERPGRVLPSVVERTTGVLRHYGMLVELSAAMLAMHATSVAWSSAAIALSIAALASRRALR